MALLDLQGMEHGPTYANRPRKSSTSKGSNCGGGGGGSNLSLLACTVKVSL